MAPRACGQQLASDTEQHSTINSTSEAMDDKEEPLSAPRAMLEALASAAIVEALEPAQVAYEKWLDDVDYQGSWPQIPWCELDEETKTQWQGTLQGVQSIGMSL
jgi:hypothetical protein